MTTERTSSKFFLGQRRTKFLNQRFAMLLTLAVMSCGGYAAGQKTGKWKDDPNLFAELGQAPKKDNDRGNPLEHDLDAVAAGNKLFGLHCAECHGNSAQGAKKGPSLLGNEVQQATPGALFWVLTNGVVRHGMPVWSKLPEPQRWQIVSYIKSLKPVVKTAP